MSRWADVHPDRSALLREALTPGSTDATIRRYLAEAPEPELVLDDEARAGLAQHASDTIKVAILTLAQDYEPAWAEREDEDAAFWADVEKWSQG